MTTEPGPVLGVGVAVVDGTQILLVERGRDPGRGQWAVPGGKVRYGEPIRAAAAREVREETGLEIDVGDVIWAGDSIGPGRPPSWHYAIVDFIGTPMGGILAAADDASDARWVEIDRAEDLPLVPTMPSLLDIIRTRR
jgi:8-oxo-dGTP diphosphatase